MKDIRVLKSFPVIKDYSSGKLIGVSNDGQPFITDDLIKAKIWSNAREATDYRDKFPMENWIFVQAYIKLSKKQPWNPR